MRKALATSMVWLSVLFVTQSATAVVYVPGEYRSDGVYIPPHFRGESEPAPGLPWFQKMLEDQGIKKDAKLPPAGPDEAHDERPPRIVTQ